MSIALRSLGLLDLLSSTPAGPLVSRLGSTPVCIASLRNLVKKAGLGAAWLMPVSYPLHDLPLDDKGDFMAILFTSSPLARSWANSLSVPSIVYFSAYLKCLILSIAVTSDRLYRLCPPAVLDGLR